MPAQAIGWNCAGIFYAVDIVSAKQLDILEFCGESPQTIRARCGCIRYFPDPLGIVSAKQLDILEFIL